MRQLNATDVSCTSVRSWRGMRSDGASTHAGFTSMNYDYDYDQEEDFGPEYTRFDNRRLSCEEGSL